MEKFWARVVKTDACWLWTGAKSGKGYGVFWAAPRHNIMAHRMAWELVHGPIPDGLVIDHLCRVHACVNPDHLEPVTMQENILRGEGLAAINARKTHCPQGHPYDTHAYRARNGDRQCLICKRRAQHVYDVKRGHAKA